MEEAMIYGNHNGEHQSINDAGDGSYMEITMKITSQ